MVNFSRLLIVIAFAALAGCSTLTELRSDLSDKVFGREPPNPPAQLEEISPTYNAKIDWSSNGGKTEKYDYTPALDSSAVYAANTAGEILKLDAANGRQIWRVSVGEPISGGVGIGAGILLVGTNKGNVHAYDVAGKALWKAKVSSEILSVPRYFDGLVIVRTGDNRIFGLDAADGSRKWVYERISPALTLRSSVGLVVDSGAVYAGFAGGKMVAIRADNGKLLWEATVAQPKGVTEIERIADITSLPVVDGPIVYAVAYQGKIAAIDRRSGKVLWNRDISSYSGLNVEDARIFVSHTLGAVYSLDYETGKTFWRQGALANRRLTAPLPMGNVVAVGDLEGYVHFLTRDEGKFAARIKLDSNAVMSLVPGSSATQLIAETRDGGLYAISVAENAAKATSTPSTSTPAPTADPTSEVQREPVNPSVLEPSAPSEERSIMFQKNDSILLPDVEQQPSTENSAPGIYLPSPEAQ
jgi:outer membrane protein assembly factor BamB